MTLRPAVPTLSLLALLPLAACGHETPPSSPPVGIFVATVERRDVPVVLQATGTVEPLQTAAVAAQVDGILQQVTFREGDEVQVGQKLFQIDPRPYDAALAQAEATLARDVAQAANAERDRARFEDLAVSEYVTAQQLDQARANVTALMATVRADSAALSRARLDLERATVRAPITGRAGGLLVRAGNLVRAAGGQPLVVINQMAPILVRFPVPAPELPLIRDALSPPVTAVPVGGSTAVENGVLVFVDNAVDSLTGTILLKASFPNRDRRLWPGALVRVALRVSTQSNVLVVPVSAVLSGQQGSSVFVVSDSGRAWLRQVTVARATDSLMILSAGVKEGETVVSAGQVRLTDGAPVKILGVGGDSAGAAR
jgi:multidrug efflux system membrane fusion protein